MRNALEKWRRRTTSETAVAYTLGAMWICSMMLMCRCNRKQFRWLNSNVSLRSFILFSMQITYLGKGFAMD